MPASLPHHWLLTAALSLTLGLSACGSKEERKAEHMTKGLAFLEQADYDKARVEFKNVLQIDPKDAEGFYRIGLIEEREENWRSAFGNYLKAVELNPGLTDAQVRLGRLYLLAGENAKAEEIVQTLLAKNPNEVGGRTLKAAMLARGGNLEAAIAEASAVTAANPQYAEAFGLLAGLYARKGDLGRAQETLRQGLKGTPKSLELRTALATTLMQQGNTAGAEREFQELVKLEPKDVSHRLRLARFYATTKQMDKAERELRGAIAADPENEEPYLTLVRFIGATKGAPAAEQQLRAFIQDQPELYRLQFALADLYRSSNRTAEAITLYQGIIDQDKIGPNGLKARNYYASLLLKQNEMEKGEALLAEVLKENPKDLTALSLRGRLALSRGDGASAVRDFRTVVNEQPNSAESVGLLARAHLLNKEPQLARDVIAGAAERFPKDAQLRVLYADFLASNHEVDAALKQVDEALAGQPKNVPLLQEKVKLLVAKKDWPAAEAAMAALQGVEPGLPLDYYRFGVIYQAQNKLDAAKAQFEKALQAAPNAIEPLSGLVNVLVAQKKGDEALARVEAVLRANPKNYLAALLKGELELSRKEYAQAEQSFRRVIEITPKLGAAYLDLANVYVARGDLAQATKTLQQGQRQAPNEARIATALAEMYRQQGDTERAIATYEALLKQNPKYALAANNLAAILLDSRNDRESHDRALQLVKSFESGANPAFTDTAGWAYYRVGDYNRAASLLQEAVDKAPTIPVFQYHLGMALHKKGETEQAKKHLQAALETNTTFPGADEAKRILAGG